MNHREVFELTPPMKALMTDFVEALSAVAGMPLTGKDVSAALRSLREEGTEVQINRQDHMDLLVRRLVNLKRRSATS